MMAQVGDSFKSFIRIISQPFAAGSTIRKWNMKRKRKLRDEWNCHVQQFKPYKLNKTVLSFLFYTGVPEHLRTVESNVLHAADTAALDYRSTQMAQCSMTGVAGALIAQIANSSLQLQYMLTVNPIVPGLCTSSLVIALLCVYYSFRMHYSLARCTFAKDLRTAFAERIPVGTGGDCREGGPGSGEGGEETGVRDRRLEEGIAEPIEEGGERILASYTATLMLWLPLYLLVLAISSYLVTIFMYWGFAAGMNLEGRAKENTVVVVLTGYILLVAGYQWIIIVKGKKG